MSTSTITPPFIKGDWVSIKELSDHYMQTGSGMVLSDGLVVAVEGEVVTVNINGEQNKFAPRASDGVFERLILPNRTMMHHVSMYQTKTDPQKNAPEKMNLFEKVARVFK